MYTLWALYYYMYGTRMHACVPSLLFFGVHVPSLTAVSYVIWFGDPRLRKRELPSSLCPFLFLFFYGLRRDDNRHTHTLYQYLSIYRCCCLPNPGPLSQRYRMRFGSVTLGCGRESCLPLSVLFLFFLWSQTGRQQTHAHAVPVPVYLPLLLSTEPGQ